MHTWLTHAHRHIPTELAHSTDTAIYGQELDTLLDGHQLPCLDELTMSPAKSGLAGFPFWKDCSNSNKICKQLILLARSPPTCSQWSKKERVSVAAPPPGPPGQLQAAGSESACALPQSSGVCVGGGGRQLPRVRMSTKERLTSGQGAH